MPALRGEEKKERGWGEGVTCGDGGCLDRERLFFIPSLEACPLEGVPRERRGGFRQRGVPGTHPGPSTLLRTGPPGHPSREGI